MDHFPDLTHRVAAQTVVVAHTGKRKWQHGETGQIPPGGSSHLCKSKSVIERHLKLKVIAAIRLQHN